MPAATVLCTIVAVGCSYCATACAVPFLLDPVAALRAPGPVPGATCVLCTGLVAAFLVGVAARVCGGPAGSVAAATLLDLGLPAQFGVATLRGPARSPAMDEAAAGCGLLDGVCDCDPSAPRGAEADAREGEA